MQINSKICKAKRETNQAGYVYNKFWFFCTTYLTVEKQQVLNILSVYY
jgi:hypothetical protein